MTIMSLLDEVNEIRDELNQQRLEAEKWITDHNECKAYAPDKDKDLAESLTDMLRQGEITLGGARPDDVTSASNRGKKREDVQPVVAEEPEIEAISFPIF